MTPRDALLMQLSWMTSELLRTSKETPQLGEIVSDFRETYGDDTLLNSRTMAGDVSSILADLAKALVLNSPEEDRASLFNELSVSEQETAMAALLKRQNPVAVVDSA